MTCARCEELEAEIAYLKGEAGEAARLDELDRLRRGIVHLQTRNKVGRRGTALLIMALYRANGRSLSSLQILEQIPPQDHAVDDDRRTNLVSVWVCWARKSLGSDAIENAWGRGYRLSPAGMARVAEILSPTSVAA